LSLEIQELLDVIRVIVLIDLSKGNTMEKSSLKSKIDKICTGHMCIETSDLDNALKDMSSEGLVSYKNEGVQLTEQGLKLGKEWQSLLMKKEPIIEVVAGLVDGSITGLVVTLSAFIANLGPKAAAFAAFLSLAAVSITNFSSFLLGGITEDLADMLTLQTLIDYSLSDIPDKTERDKSLLLVKQLFTVLHKEISRSNLYAAVICSTTTFVAGAIPIVGFLALPRPFDIVLSLTIVVAVTGIFLVRYRSKRTKVHWRITLLETVAIIMVATIASLVMGGIS
jgi:DNA-binding PadR family transcriptional regulator/VIT1/CCC1 family predicted Fe2+/Mn2+ transporter